MKSVLCCLTNTTTTAVPGGVTDRTLDCGTNLVRWSVPMQSYAHDCLQHMHDDSPHHGRPRSNCKPPPDESVIVYMDAFCCRRRRGLAASPEV